MMESIEQKLTFVSSLLLFAIVLCSCKSSENSNNEKMQLEGILSNIIISKDGDSPNGSYLVGQHDGWSTSSSMIIVSYIPSDKAEYINATEKSNFDGKDVFFYRTDLTEITKESEFKKIPNELSWGAYVSVDSLGSIDQFDPLTVQLIYNFSLNCIEKVLSGEMYMRDDYKTCP